MKFTVLGAQNIFNKIFQLLLYMALNSAMEIPGNYMEVFTNSRCQKEGWA